MTCALFALTLSIKKYLNIFNQIKHQLIPTCSSIRPIAVCIIISWLFINSYLHTLLKYSSDACRPAAKNLFCQFSWKIIVLSYSAFRIQQDTSILFFFARLNTKWCFVCFLAARVCFDWSVVMHRIRIPT